MDYFKEREFNMGGEPCFDMMDSTILMSLDILRELVKRPFTITSSYRSISYNKKVGGAKHSQHRTGKAVDVSTYGWSSVDKAKLVLEALKMDLSVGIAKSFIHIDCRAGKPKIWTY